MFLALKHVKVNATPHLWARGKAAWLDTAAALLRVFLEVQARAAVGLPGAPQALDIPIAQAAFAVAAPAPGMPPPAAALVAQAAFDGSQHGADYLVLLPGEQVGISKFSDKTHKVDI